jgi:hypothetical protein
MDLLSAVCRSQSDRRFNRVQLLGGNAENPDYYSVYRVLIFCCKALPENR